MDSMTNHGNQREQKPQDAPGAAAAVSRRRGLRRGLKLAFVAPAVLASVLPGEAAASSGPSSRKSKGNRGSPRPAPAPRPVGPALVQVNQPSAPRPALPQPQGTQRLTSALLHVEGPDGSGAGPVRVDLDGAQPNSAYEVAFVPASNPGAPVPLGTIRTDGRGAYHGAAPQPLPPIAPPDRAGILVLTRLPTL
jgi:hypothetical protein